jgi:hypothetical protein
LFKPPTNHAASAAGRRLRLSVGWSGGWGVLPVDLGQFVSPASAVGGVRCLRRALRPSGAAGLWLRGMVRLAIAFMLLWADGLWLGS